MVTPLSRALEARLAYLELTKEQLAERSGLGRSTIYAFAAGSRSDPQGSTLRKLAEGLRMTPAQLLQAVNGSAETPPQIDPRLARIMQLLPSIPKDRLAAIEQHVALAVQPPPRQSANRRRDGAANRRAGDTLDHQLARHQREHSGDNAPLPNALRALVSFVSRFFVPSNAAYPSLPDPVTLAAI